MFELTLDTGNAAFAEGPNGAAYETARILRAVIAKLEAGADSGVCIDVNGNNVGNWYLETDDEDEESDDD